MSSAQSEMSSERISDVIGHIRSKGVRLWSKEGRLHYKAPKGALTQDEINRLQGLRAQIVALLETTSEGETVEGSLRPRPHFDRAPLSFTQLAYSQFFQLHGPRYENRSTRLVSSALRLQGRLQVAALQDSVSGLIVRHDALRTRLVPHEGGRIQQIDATLDYEMEVIDLSAVPEDDDAREREIIRCINELILEPIDLAVGPLFAIRLLKLGEQEHVLVLAMEHLISDGTSLGILTRDLFAAYTAAVSGRTLSLPKIPIQFADFAVWQRQAHRLWTEKHGSYWHERLSGLERLRFPQDREVPETTHLGWGTVPLRIGKRLKAELRECCRSRHTTLVMAVFTAYVALVLRWCGVAETVVQYQSNGRVGPEVENTIGFFASILYLRLRLGDTDSFDELTKRVTQEYCQAYAHADFSFMATREPQPGFTKNTYFNWAPRGSTPLDLSALEGSEEALTCRPLPFPDPVLSGLELDHEPGMQLYEAHEEIGGEVHFRRDRFSPALMERFARHFLVLIREWVRDPGQRVRDIELV